MDETNWNAGKNNATLPATPSDFMMGISKRVAERANDVSLMLHELTTLRNQTIADLNALNAEIERLQGANASFHSDLPASNTSDPSVGTTYRR